MSIAFSQFLRPYPPFRFWFETTKRLNCFAQCQVVFVPDDRWCGACGNRATECRRSARSVEGARHESSADCSGLSNLPPLSNDNAMAEALATVDFLIVQFAAVRNRQIRYEGSYVSKMRTPCSTQSRHNINFAGTAAIIQ